MHRVSVLLLTAIVAAAVCPFKAGKVESAGNGKDAGCPFATQDLQDPFRGPDVTENGCICKTPCGASATDLFNCDWCFTQGNCGKVGLKGRSDKCVYPVNNTYESQDWDAKLNQLWKNIDADHTSGSANSAAGGFTESVQTSFDNIGDTMPIGRSKVIHGIGAVCKFKLEMSSSSPFTGVFKAGDTAHGLIRMGSALPVDTKSGVVPGLGIKFLRSKVPSANFVALVSLSPLPNNEYNFFAETFSNHIPPAAGVAAIALAKKFTQKSGCPTQVGLSDICKYDSDGNTADKPAFPFQVTLRSKVVQFPSTPINQGQLQEQLASIPAGTPLFEVGYFSDPKESQSGAPATILGTMVTDGPCVNSKFGDERLFFKHQLIEEDWAAEPYWMGYLDHQKDCSIDRALSQTPPQPQCPQPKHAGSDSALKSEAI